MSEEQALLTLDGFGVSFGKRVVLSSVELALPTRGIDVLMGPVKTGKSTLLRSLMGLNQANALFRSWGQASLRGQPLPQASGLALVQQHAAFLNANVRDALIFHVRQRQEKSSSAWNAYATEVLETHGLRQLVAHLSTSMITLPSAIQRAVNILAHALAEPELLMVDEPTYGLDDPAAMQLMEWLKIFGAKQRMLVILHHQGQARKLADRVILLGGGRILAYEPVGDFFQRPVNAWVDQFLRTGSLSIASPDARAEELSPEVPPPPPLPLAAVQAVAPFMDNPVEGSVPAQVRPVAEVVVPPAPEPAAPPAPIVLPAPAPKPEVLNTPQPNPLIAGDAVKVAPVNGAGTTPQPVPEAPASPRMATLPPLSAHGVEEASMVGRVILADSRGPQGFHWIIPGKLAGCPEPGVISPMAYDLDLLANMGISYLITLTEKDLDQSMLIEAGLHNIHLPIFDREAPSISQAYMLVRRMQLLMDKGQTLAVHCKAGIGRTGTILAAWLIREGGLSAVSAMERLRNINPAYVQTEIQEQFLHEFEDDLLRRL